MTRRGAIIASLMAPLSVPQEKKSETLKVDNTLPVGKSVEILASTKPIALLIHLPDIAENAIALKVQMGKRTVELTAKQVMDALEEKP